MSIDRVKICKELKVIKRIEETSDAVSFVLEVPRTTGGQFQYKAGQFVTLFLDINGEEVRRSYSLASSPDTDSDFKITIKLVPGGKGSTHLMKNVKAGDKLWVTPPAGHFCLPQEIKGHNFAFFAAGSGVTPILSLLKSALKLGATKCALLFQNRNENSIIFKNELEELAKKYSSQLSVTHILSSPSTAWAGNSGRLTNEFANKFIQQQFNEKDVTNFICGPSGFIETADMALRSIGIDPSLIKKESFTVPIQTTCAGQQDNKKSFSVEEDSVLIGDRGQIGEPLEIEAVIDGTTHKVAYKKDKTVLECLLEADLNPPYSCLDGACMACIAKVQSGLVFQNDMGILTEDNIDAGDCLTCQARPASPVVKVNYEIL